ncbi:hypothetical protein Y032_0100g3225 [Ancylostoma ceylanicum]|nr:hypothetical protein Y032_0100g3225 [Ancylostoma ceylanicum]
MRIFGDSSPSALSMMCPPGPSVLDDYVLKRATDLLVPVTLAIEPAVDVEKLRSREMKWIHMMDNWRYFMDEKYTTVRKRCRKGIPPSVRGKAWKYLCGATYQMEVSTNRTVFDRCLDQAGDPKWIDDIEKDLNRQFPNHEMFSRYGKYGDGGKDDLFQLLKAWTVLHPEEGYCQGQAPVASVLLMHMPLRDAFYCFVQVCHRYLPDYYSPGLEAVQVDGDILVQLLKDKSRVTYQHLDYCGYTVNTVSHNSTVTPLGKFLKLCTLGFFHNSVLRNNGVT